MPTSHGPRATFHRLPPRGVCELTTEDGHLVVVLNGTGALAHDGAYRVLAPGDTVHLSADSRATFTASAFGSGVELLRVRVPGALEEEGAASDGSSSAANASAIGVADRRIAHAIRLMQSELGRRWTVEELARKVGLSRAVFARIFKGVTDHSPLKHLARLRLARASELLRESDLGLAEIAAHIGYQSEFAFSRAFKRRYGVAPGTFRRTSRGTTPMLAIAA